MTNAIDDELQSSASRGFKFRGIGRVAVCMLIYSGLLFFGCSAKIQKRQVFTPQQALAGSATARGAQVNEAVPSADLSPFLKAHMKSGGIYVFRDWKINGSAQTVSGDAQYLDFNRDSLSVGALEISLDSVALFETNQIKVGGAVSALGFMTLLSIPVSIACALNPKACFGSCPTFYASDGSQMILQAEGFSSSVAPALEARDIDALYRISPGGTEFSLLMTNEAYETHVVRYADLLVVPRPPGGRFFATCPGEFWQADNIVTPVSCLDESGECLEKIRYFDSVERFSRTDSFDLAASEYMELEFENIHGPDWGIVIATRQSLVTTYLFYQALSYLGTNAGACLAAMGRDNGQMCDSYKRYADILGGLEVQIMNEAGEWFSAGSIRETGPLATDTHLLPLPGDFDGGARLRIKQSRGAWRIDYIALTHLVGKIEPQRIHPAAVAFNGVADEAARARLLDPERALVTLPGDSVKITYVLPADPGGYEYFLESRGYYLEWMRQEWLAEENLAMAALVYNDPREVLRMLAPEYKKVEAEMEQLFWSSRYAK